MKLLTWDIAQALLDALAIVQEAQHKVAVTPCPADLWKNNRIANYLCLQYIEIIK